MSYLVFQLITQVWWLLLFTCCHLDHVSHATCSPRLAFKLLSDNCAWHTSLLTGDKHKTGILCGRLSWANVSPLGSGRRRALLVPRPSCSLFIVPRSPNTLKFFKNFSSAQCYYLLQRVTRCYPSPGYTFSAGTACLWLGIN